MLDKSKFTPDEWKLLLESVMMASITITAAEPHGLWGLLQESFAGGTELAKAKMTPARMSSLKRWLPISEPPRDAASRAMA